MIYIKPWDSTVFENFFVFIKTFQELEEQFEISVDVIVSKELNDEYSKREELRRKYEITK